MADKLKYNRRGGMASSMSLDCNVMIVTTVIKWTRRCVSVSSVIYPRRESFARISHDLVESIGAEQHQMEQTMQSYRLSEALGVQVA